MRTPPKRRQTLNIRHRGTLVINVGARTQIKITMTTTPRKRPASKQTLKEPEYQ
jgi:hypothetical protein